ncbi:MAG: four helix bundle protein [Cyclobacteriaceae bacterium]
MSYKNLEIWQEARLISIKIHEMTFTLPKFEQFEEAQQIRRSSKSVRSNIVEGYGRRRYKQDFIKFLIYALSSNDETIDHLEILFETKSLTDEAVYQDLHKRLEILGRKTNNFLKSVERNHNKLYRVIDPELDNPVEAPPSIQNQASATQNPESSNPS